MKPSKFATIIFESGLKHIEIAEKLEIGYPAWVRKRGNGFFTVKEVFIMAELFKKTPEDILYIIHDSLLKPKKP